MLNRVFGQPDQDQQEWLLLLSASLLMLTAGTNFLGPVIAHSMRSAFDLTQSELEVAMVSQYYGMVLMFASGLVYDRWGPRVTIAIGGIASTAASLAVTLAFAFPQPLYGRPWILWFLFFVYGHAVNYSEVAAIATVLSDYRSDRRGRAVAFLENCIGPAPLLFALLHYVVFGNMFRPPDAQNAVGTLAVQTVLAAASHAVAFVFIRSSTSAEMPVEVNEKTPNVQKHQPFDPNEDLDASSSKAGTGLSSLERGESTSEFIRATFNGCLSWSYVLLLMGFALGSAQDNSLWLNTTSITQSLGLSGNDIIFFSVGIVTIPFRFLIGDWTDRILAKPQDLSAVLFAGVTAFGTPALLLITLNMVPGSSPLGVILSSFILSDLHIAILFTLVPVLLSQIIPQALFGRLHSACLLLGTLLSLPLALQYGLIYDLRAAATNRPSNATVNGAANTTISRPICMGQECYTTGNIANSVCHFVSVGCFLALTALLHCRAKESVKQENPE